MQGIESRKKNIIRFAVFMVIVLALVAACTGILGFADSENTGEVLEDFYDLEENTVDCIYIGSSVVQRGSVTPIAWRDHGIASYSFATGTQPFVLIRYIMEEAQKTQDPKLFVVELKSICKYPDDIVDVSVRRVVDNMKPSMTRYRAIRAVTEYAKGGKNNIDTTGLSYYFPLLKYHSRWNPAKQPEKIETIDYYNGYAMDYDVCFGVQEIQTLNRMDYYEPIDKKNEEVLIDLLDYCDSLDADVMFMMSPYGATEKGIGRMNYARSIVEERGYECLNFLPEDARERVGLDNRSCYYNQEHLNYYGAVKFTEYMSNHIAGKYDVEDRRGNTGYKDYDRQYDMFEKSMKGKYADNYNEMMRKVRKVEENNR